MTGWPRTANRWGLAYVDRADGAVGSGDAATLGRL